MVQARIEPSPAEQLRELRKARDRYAALAEQLHDSADPELDPDQKLARELDARRILRSYEKSISNSVVRMSSMDKTHRFARPSLGMRAWLVIFVVISAVEGGILLVHSRPEIFNLLRLQIMAGLDRVADRAAPAPRVERTRQPIAAPPPRPTIVAPVITPRVEGVPAPQARPEPSPAPTLAALPPFIAAAPKPLDPPQLVLIAPPPVDAPSMPVIVLEPPPAAQPAPIAPPQAAPVAPIAPPQAPPPAAATLVPPQQPSPRTAVLTRPEAIAATHTRPPYPNEAKRLGEGGTTRMRLAITPQGAAGACEIVKSAGSDQLDAAACTYVQRVWRWKPATQDGQPVAASTEVTIVWNLLSTR